MLYSILTFYLVIVLNVNFLKCFSWDFGDVGDVSNRIHRVCTFKCDFNLAINGDEFYCDQSCQDHMCREGCGLYEDAITTLTCSDLCTDYVHQKLNVSEAESDIRITQVPKQSCTQGCSFRLDEYFTELTIGLEGVLPPPPVPVLENIGHDHVELSWDYESLFDNLKFFLQKKVLDTNTDWQVHTPTTRLPSGNFLVEELHPYITYQFKIIFEFTTVHSVETRESANITTRSHGVPSSSPLITSISTPSTTVISISWEPPVFTNGPLVSYRLTVRPVDSSKHEIQNDVLADVHAWIFGHLHSGEQYEVFVSAVNNEGEGPAHSQNVTTPAAGNLSDHETPYLILGADNMVVKLRLLELAHRDAEPVLTKPKSILVTGVGVHVERQLVLVADDSSVVTLTSISGDQQADDIYPMLAQPTAIDIDWLHNLAYVVDGYRVFRCTIQWIGNHCTKILDLVPNSVREIKVDPINGFLYFTTYGMKGLFRKDLANFSDHSKITPLIDSDLHTFVLDYESFLLYIPNNPNNTVMSAYLDGTGLTDVRQGTVVRPYFINIASMVLYDGKFFWTNGSVLYSEEFDKNRAYYHNALALLEKHFCGFNLYYPSVQPVPIPTNPPANVQVLFTAAKAIIQWDIPEKLQFQGDGAYKNWLYEVNILQDDGSNNLLHQTEKQQELVVTNLEADTQYKVKVRAKSSAGTGPWSEVFNGRTLKEELDSVELLVAVRHQYKMWEIKQFSIDGEDEKMLVETSPLSPGVTDLAWFQDVIFWTTEDGELFMFDGETTKVLDFVSDASCVAVDWLGEKLYWSVYKNGVIKRSDMYGQNVEFVYQALARDMIIDSIQGRIYWVTMNSLETANLNGDNSLTYFSVPYFSGNYVISLTLDLDLQKVFWYVKGFENEDLYMADMVGYRKNDVVESVKLVANFQNVAKFSPLKYFSSRLFWLDDNQSVTVGDTHCNYSSSLSRIGSQVTMFNIRHPSLQPIPGKLDSSTVCVIPKEIPPSSIKATGSWSYFNVTWQPSLEVNHGDVSYEVSVEAEAFMMKDILITKDPWYDIEGLPPYSLVTVTVRGYTYWGLGKMTKTTVRSPMSVPGGPEAPKVYVTQRKNAASSKVTLAADFRWSEPESINGILSSQSVFYWKSSEPDKVSSMALSASARHFILDDLQGNTTYFFQVEACTEVGCGPKSVVANATADAVNPVPKLLIATESGVLLAEADNIVNTSVTMTAKSAVTMAYLAQEEMVYWVNRDMYMEEYHQGKTKKLFQLEGTVADLSIDWISRTIFIVENRDNEGRIKSYEIDREQQRDVIVRNEKSIGNVILDPYTSSIIWSERDTGSQTWHMYRSHITGSNVTRFFSDSSRKKRAVNVPCSCHSNQNSASVLSMDLSQDGHTEVIFVDKNNNIVASDVYGCHCRTLLTTSPQEPKGLPPDLLTVDHVHIYWYNFTQSRLYLLDKENGKLSSRPLRDVTDIYPYGAHLQPLPASQCLDTSPYTDTVDIVSVTNTSVMVRLHPVTWPDACENISQPSLRYTVYYRKHDDRSPSDHCGPSGQWCITKESYNREITIDGLDPYTNYTVQGAVSNYYSKYSATSLGDPSRITTKPGVPSAVGNITTKAESPNSIEVMWPPTTNPNGPVHKIEYYVHWSTKSTTGTSNSMMTGAIRHEDLDPHNNELFSWTLQNLSPSHLYRIQVICNQTEGNFVQESLPVFVTTFDEPDNITLIDRTNTTMSVAWQPPSDVEMFSIHYAMVHDGPLNYVIYNLPEERNSTLYNATLSNLLPNTEYSFRLNILYRGSFSAYQWPQDGTNTKYVFKTLTGIPGYPEPPVIEEITTGEFEVSWLPPHDFGENITYYLLQYRHIDKENWSYAVNTTDTRWVLDDRSLPRGFTYVFRIKAQNKNGWGPYSLNSSMFSYPILQAVSDDTMMTVVAIVCALVVVLLAMVIIAICITVCKRRNEERKKKTEFIAVARGPDLELATLRELPTTVIHQNNTLYAINVVPTDDDIAALPHFRRDQLVLCKFLGSGAFGEVFEGVAKNIINESSGDTKVAVKTLRKSASDQEKEEFLKEALLMSNFRHAHILSLLGVCLDNDPQFIILELMEGGDLLSFMRACRLSSIQNRSELSLTDLVKICVHVARGCKYLEDMHFVHRDLAARNCLVSSCNPSEMVVKIGDFGLARDIYKNDYYRKEGEGLLPVRWMSPESLTDGVFTTQSDIWAFGVLMWEVVTFGQQPYPARTNIEVLHFVRSGGRLDRPDNCPEDFYQLMCKCWSFASEDRPSFAYLLQQLEQFQETCASISEYLVPIRSSNQPIAAVAGLSYLRGRRERLTSTSSDGPEYYHITHTPYGSHRMYGSIRRATSFDSPEPKDATQQICTDSSNYLEPKSCSRAQYIEFLPDSQTQNYMYNLEGERVREIEIARQDSTSAKIPLYVQTTVKENESYNSIDNVKYLNQKRVSSPAPYMYIDKNADGKNGSMYDTVPVLATDADKLSSREAETTGLTNHRRGSSVSTSQNAQISPEDVKYATIKYTRPRKQRLDSGTSSKSFDSIQTEPAYYMEPQTYRSILNSSSSSRSNYSMSHIPEHAPVHSEYYVTDGNEDDKYWANNNSSVTYTKVISPIDTRGPVDYLNTSRRAQVYPESAGVLAGYDIVQSSLV